MTDEEHRPLSEQGPLSPGFEMRYDTLRGEKGETGEKGDQGPRGAEGRGVTRRTARSVVFLFALAVIVGGSALFVGASAKNAAAHAVGANNAKWCTVMDLLTRHPVPYPADAAKNPSRLQAYVLYSDFHQLRHQLGCG